MYQGSDIFTVKQYLLRSVSRSSFWKGWNFTDKQDAVSALNSLDNTQHAVNQWIEQWLNAAQKSKLDSAIRNARQRVKGKSITISNEAHKILKDLADADKLTLSEVIEQRLKRAHLNLQKRN